MKEGKTRHTYLFLEDVLVSCLCLHARDLLLLLLRLGFVRNLLFGQPARRREQKEGRRQFTVRGSDTVLFHQTDR